MEERRFAGLNEGDTEGESDMFELCRGGEGREAGSETSVSKSTGNAGGESSGTKLWVGCKGDRRQVCRWLCLRLNQTQIEILVDLINHITLLRV